MVLNEWMVVMDGWMVEKIKDEDVQRHTNTYDFVGEEGVFPYTEEYFHILSNRTFHTKIKTKRT